MEQVDRKWLVVYTKPRSEKKVAERLLKNSIDAYCPIIQTMKQWSDRKKKVSIPMFTSYVFVQVNEMEREYVLRDSGVLNFVYWIGKPAVIRAEEIEAIKDIATNGLEVTLNNDRLDPGEIITIPEGPFKGLKGKVASAGNSKVELFIEQLSCRISFVYN